MRPVEKGIAPSTYRRYQQARNELAERIGWYCSYCETPVKNMIEVEHVIPKDLRPDLRLSWENFLLACKYCNTVKRARNTDRAGYLWPDQDNTDLAFQYSETAVIEPMHGLVTNIQAAAQKTIDLMGLDRRPGGTNEPTPADTRYISRFEAWIQAKASLNRWHQAPIPPMAEQIAISAAGFGHFSIWNTVFAGESIVLGLIRLAFIGTFSDTDGGGVRLVRSGGIL